jgi:hypothetical protein
MLKTMTYWQTGVFSLFSLLALSRAVSAQPQPTRWAPQNFAFTLSLDASDKEKHYTVNPTTQETGLQYTIRAISTSFIADSSGVYGLVVVCRSANYTGTAAQIAHAVPIFRHQPGNQAGSDRFSGAFGGAVSCLLDSPIVISISRSNSKDTATVQAPVSVSGIIERVPAVAPR